jgi:hypothetical protein
MLYDKYTYKNYVACTSPTLEQDKRSGRPTIKRYSPKTKSLKAQLEDNFVNYDDDQLLLNHVMQKYAEGFTEEDENAFISGILQWEEEKKFGMDLLKNATSTMRS